MEFLDLNIPPLAIDIGKMGPDDNYLDWVLLQTDKITKQAGKNISNLLSPTLKDAKDVSKDLLSSNPLIVPVIGAGVVLALLILVKI